MNRRADGFSRCRQTPVRFRSDAECLVRLGEPAMTHAHVAEATGARRRENPAPRVKRDQDTRRQTESGGIPSAVPGLVSRTMAPAGSGTIIRRDFDFVGKG